MSAQKGNIFIPLLTIFALVATLTAGYLFWQSQQLQNKPTTQYSNPTPTITTQDETANWITYTSPELGISFKYPPTGMVESETDSVKVWQQKDKKTAPGTDAPPGTPFVSFMVFPKTDNLEEFIFSRELPGGENAGLKFISKRSVNFGADFKGTEYTLESDMGRWYPIYLEANNKTFRSISQSAYMENGNNFLDQILSTFKFTSQN